MLDNAQQFFSASAPPPRQRQPSGLAGSIWAPQPEPSDKTWPKKLDSFSERELTYVPRIENRIFNNMVREDVFGPQAAGHHAAARPYKDIGAIGDGRKRISPGDYDDSVRVKSPFCVMYAI